MQNCTNVQNDLIKNLIDLTNNNYFAQLDCNYLIPDEFNNKFDKNLDSFHLSMIHLNMRSLNSKFLEFCSFIQQLDIDFDIIVLSEIWATNINFYSNLLPGYLFIYDLPKNAIV